MLFSNYRRCSPHQPYSIILTKKRQLYVDLDASKEFGFGAHVYHSSEDKESRLSIPANSGISSPKQKSQQPILFLSRLLTNAETRYWPTELEIAGLVWVVKKIRYMIEAATQPTIIYTDHSAVISIVRQTSLNTTSTEKLNLRLIRASEYLQRFRLDIRYKPGKINIVPDALSRLASREYRPESEAVLDVLTVKCFPVSLVEVSSEYRQRLLEGYREPRWTRVLQTLRENDALGSNAAALPYRVINDLLYFDDDERGLRLCIPSSMEADVFKLAHDEMGHPGYARTHERLTEGVYIYNMATKLHEFIRHCPNCQLNQTPRHKPYGSLQPIILPSRPFHTLTIDFVLALPESPEQYDCLMSVTDKFAKTITFIPGKSTWTAKDWAIKLLDRLAELNWGLPRAIISDRDRKFVGQLWKQIFSSLKVSLLYSTAWHPQTDGMSERSNQTAEIALRYYIATLLDPRQWPTVLPRLSASLNNSTKYSSTAKTPTQIMYGFRTREALDFLRIDDPETESRLSDNALGVPDNSVPGTTPKRNPEPGRLNDANVITRTRQTPRQKLNPGQTNDAVGSVKPAIQAPVAMDEYRPSHIDAKDAIALAALKMKEYYDSSHLPMFFDRGDLVNLRLHKGYRVPGITSKKIGTPAGRTF